MKRFSNLEARIADLADEEEDDWPKIRNAVIVSLDDVPDAKTAVLDALSAHRGECLEWPALRSLILSALEGYPDVRAALIESLAKVGA